jgi:hypothetical protein
MLRRKKLRIERGSPREATNRRNAKKNPRRREWNNRKPIAPKA